MPPTTQRWLLRTPSEDAAARLFCLPYAGAGASVFRRWPDRLGEFEVCPIQAPGRENRLREPAPEDFDGFARDALEAVAPYLDRPYAVFGHCMGALLAHSLAAAMYDDPHVPDPGRLYVSSSKVPHWEPDRRYRLPSTGSVGVYHPTLSDGELGDEISKVAQRQGGELGAELLPLAVRVLRADLSMCFRYDPRVPRPVGAPVTAVAWRSDDDVTPEDMRAWADCGELRAHVLDGDKMTFVEAPEALQEVLRRDWADTVTTATPETPSEVLR